MDTRTQYRAICPACFAQQAVRPNGVLVPHGYTRPQGWHQNANTCAGANVPHFGTAEGRDYTVAIIDRLRQQAVTLEVEAANVEAGLAPVWAIRRVVNTSRRTLHRLDSPLPWQRTEYARKLIADAGLARLNAEEFQRRVDSWQVVEPVPVEVEKKAGPLVHWSGGWWRGGKACAGSAMGAMKGLTTREAAHVTCPKCLGLIASGRFATK